MKRQTERYPRRIGGLSIPDPDRVETLIRLRNHGQLVHRERVGQLTVAQKLYLFKSRKNCPLIVRIPLHPGGSDPLPGTDVELIEKCVELERPSRHCEQRIEMVPGHILNDPRIERDSIRRESISERARGPVAEGIDEIAVCS